jgi:hypothetical protein
MEKDLHLALLSKEKAELFLSNLEKLRGDNAVNEMSYNALKAEYAAALQYAIIKIDHLKSEFNKTMSGKNRLLGVYKQESANLEARFKVGQIAAATFLKTSKIPEKKITFLEDEIAHLNSLINARHSAEVTVPETTDIRSLFGLLRAPEHPITPLPVSHQEPPPAPEPEPQPVVEPVKIQDSTSISSLMILPDRAFPGSTIGVIATIVNTGTEPLLHRTELKVNDRIEAVKDVNLNPGQNEELTFMTVAGSPGDYYVSVDNATGILKVLPPS